MGSTWMGLSRVGRGCCSFKYCKIPEAVKQGYHYILLGQKNNNKKHSAMLKISCPALAMHAVDLKFGQGEKYTQHHHSPV